jgi:membrane glycosyltransferase
MRRKLAERALAAGVEELKEAKMGPLKLVWTFLSGWKRVIVLLLFVAQSVCASFGITGPFQYLGMLLSALGWSASDAAMDPSVVSGAVLTLIAVGHAIVKAWREWRAGVPALHVGSVPPEVVNVDALQRNAA